MLSFKVTSAALAQAMLGRLQLIYFAESLGGVETLLTYPIEQTHKEAPAELLARSGVNDCLLRLSVGIEAPADLIADLAQALHAEAGRTPSSPYARNSRTADRAAAS